MTNIFTPSEYAFFDDISQTHLVLMLLGVKGSGKTTLMINIVKYLIYNKPNTNYDVFCLVIPNFTTDQNYSKEYNFLRGRDDVFIYNEYNLFTLQHVESLHRKGLKILFSVDDATSSFQKAFQDKKHAFLNKIVTESRHLKISLLLCAHTLASTFSPLVRTMCDYIFLFKISNSKLLEYCYYEFASLNSKYTDNRKAFFHDYANLMKTKYSCMIIDNRHSEIYDDMNDWVTSKLINYNL